TEPLSVSTVCVSPSVPVTVGALRGRPADTAAADCGLASDHPALFSASTVKRYWGPFWVWKVRLRACGSFTTTWLSWTPSRYEVMRKRLTASPFSWADDHVQRTSRKPSRAPTVGE